MRKFTTIFALTAVAAAFGVFSALGADSLQLPAPAAVKTDFTRDIEPIFSSRCYECHGEKKSKSGFRLDDKARAFQGGDSGQPFLIAGKSSQSQIIQRVAGLTNSDEVMPPKGERLTKEQIAILEAWINQGANWPDSAKKTHWAYVKPERPTLPKVRNSKWSRNPIDDFILARLEKESLSPSPEADRVTLIRRVTLDLTGLPPTIAEVDAFVAGQKQERSTKVMVDRGLLASPHFGERWARMWLDLARYADSAGYEADPPRRMWPYRDWVIKAFNRDMPFDQFTIEQIAGDMLPNATLEEKVGSGFNRNTMFNTEGGVDREQSRVETIVDRVNTTATVWLGSTLACAQCHTHKYDPFTLKEYYQMFAFFNNEDEPEIQLPSESPKESASRQIIRPKIWISWTRISVKQTPERTAAEAVLGEQMTLADLAHPVFGPPSTNQPAAPEIPTKSIVRGFEDSPRRQSHG